MHIAIQRDRVAGCVVICAVSRSQTLSFLNLHIPGLHQLFQILRLAFAERCQEIATFAYPVRLAWRTGNNLHWSGSGKRRKVVVAGKVRLKVACCNNGFPSLRPGAQHS